MKRISAIILSALLILTVLPLGASAAVNAIFTDFSVAEPANWTLDADCGTIRNGVLEITPSGSEWQDLKPSKPYPTGTVVVEYDFKSTANKVQVYLQNPKGGSICRLQQVTNKTIQFQHGNSDSNANYNTVLTTAFVKDAWYHVKHVITFRAAAKGEKTGTTSSVYLYDSQGSLIGSAEDKLCMNYWGYDSAEDLRVVRFNSNATNEADLGTVYVDNVAMYEATQESVFAINKASLAIADADAISADIVLKTVGYGGATILWESSNPSVVSNTGKVTPVNTQTNVNLTASITYNGTTETVVYPVTVVPAGSHVVSADIYAFKMQDNAVPTGVIFNTNDGYAGVRNQRLEMEKFENTTTNPQATFNLNKMVHNTFGGEVIAEYDFVSIADKAVLGYIQAAPNPGSLVRIEQLDADTMQIVTGGSNETAETTNIKKEFVRGKEYHVKIAVNYDTELCSVYINGVAVAENHHFMPYNSPGHLQTLLFQHNGTSGCLAVDNVVIYHTDADSSLIATQTMLEIPTSVTNDMLLPTAGLNGTTIAWASGYPELLTNDGKLLETPYWEASFDVTATITKVDYRVEKVFTVTVPTVSEPSSVSISDATLTSDFYGSIATLRTTLPAVATVTVTKPRNTEFSLTLIAATYNADGVLQSVTSADKVLNTVRATDTASIEITDSADADGYVQLFAWDAVSGLKPLRSVQNIAID